MNDPKVITITMSQICGSYPLRNRGVAQALLDLVREFIDGGPEFVTWQHRQQFHKSTQMQVDVRIEGGDDA